MAVFEHPEYDGHERVVHVADASSGLRAIIAIHDRTLGPAIGGCRLFPYDSEEAALRDVLRLSRGMTYKNALAGLPFGGGKSVIIADPARKSPALLAAFAFALNEFDGGYWTGEDINIGPADVEEMAKSSRFLLGRTKGERSSGDPSPFTALGCFSAMRAALAHLFGDDGFAGRTVAIQGVGNVGQALAQQIVEAGGKLVVADVRADSTARLADTVGAKVVGTDAIFDEPCDILAPCAMGAQLNRQTIPRLRASIVCGVANNQLETPEDGMALMERGITYCPDYVVNAGGMINASGDFFGNYDAAVARRGVEAIRETIAQVLERAAIEKRPTNEIADEMARAIVDGARINRSAERFGRDNAA